VTRGPWLRSALGAALACLAASGCGDDRPRNILLVTIDTMRADRAGCYGYSAGTTPVLDGLARSGTVFENARVHAPITGPSHASLLTGTFPTFHGLSGNLQALPSEGVATIAECFRDAGYRTAAAVGAFVVASEWGFARGFDTFRDELPLAPNNASVLPERPGEAVVADAVSWIAESPGEPFFLWVHLFDPHLPYAAPASFGSAFRDPYDAEVAYADSCVGTLIEELRKRKLLDDTIVVVTSDHGESLGEHTEDTHAFFLYNSTLSVPLVISAPGLVAKNHRVRALARSVDVMPTLLELAGVPIPGTVQGVSLAGQARGGAEGPSDRASFAMTDELYLAFGWSPLRSIEQGGWKYVRAPKPELYELSSDPGERTNRAAGDADRVRELEALLARELEATKGSLRHEETSIDPATLERLMSLGYIAGGTRKPTRRDSLDLAQYPDPKDRASYWQGYRQLSSLRTEGDLPKAEEVGRNLLREDPNPALIHYLFGQVLWRKSQRDPDPAILREAIGHLERAAVMDEYRNSCLVFTGIAHARLGEDDAAQRSFEEILRRNPEEPMANFNLTLLHAKKGNWPAVVQHGEALLRKLPMHPDAGAIRKMVERGRSASTKPPGRPLTQ